MNKHQSYARRSTMAVGVTSRQAEVTERVYRVTLSFLELPERVVPTVTDLRTRFPFLGKHLLNRGYSYAGQDYLEAVFLASDPNLSVLLNNALIAGSIAAYRVQLPETVLA